MSDRHSLIYIREYLLSYGYSLISKTYEDSKSPMKFCDKEGYLYEMSLDSFCSTIRKKNTPFRFFKNNRFVLKNIKNWIDKNNKPFRIKNKNIYINSNKRNLVFRCNECGQDFETSWNDVQQGRGCKYCRTNAAHKASRMPLNIVEEIFANSSVSAIDINQFAGYECKMDVICDNCGHQWKAKFGNIKSGCACPKCRESKGEKRVSEVLDSFGLRYVRQKSFDGCTYKKKLKFDFYIPDFTTVIEYNGEQHYQQVDFSHSGNTIEAEKKFKEVQLRDIIKKEYCRKNNIQLIAISYRDFKNIENIIRNNICY